MLQTAVQNAYRPLPQPRYGLMALAARVSAACDDPVIDMGAEIKAALADAVCAPDWLDVAYRQPSTERYARHVLYSDPCERFTILSLVWGPGQFSPPHAHQTWCGYAVCENTLTEGTYRYDDLTGEAQLVRTERRAPGYACFAGPGLDQIHRLGNAGDRPAISIHVYGVAQERITTGVNRLVEVTPPT